MDEWYTNGHLPLELPVTLGRNNEFRTLKDLADTLAQNQIMEQQMQAQQQLLQQQYQMEMMKKMAEQEKLKKQQQLQNEYTDPSYANQYKYNQYNQQKGNQDLTTLQYQKQQQLLLQQQQQQQQQQLIQQQQLLQQQQQQQLLQAQKKQMSYQQSNQYGGYQSGGNVQVNQNYNQNTQLYQGNQQQKNNILQNNLSNFLSEDPSLAASKLKDMLGINRQQQELQQNTIQNDNIQGSRKKQKAPVKIDESEFPSLDQAARN